MGLGRMGSSKIPAAALTTIPVNLPDDKAERLAGGDVKPV